MPSTHQVGFAGEAAVASEFSIRGYIVSLPMVDLGTDLFVEDHSTSRTWRIQVKTALEKQTQANYYQFSVKETAIHAPTAKASHFCFVLRIDGAWQIFTLSQSVLSNFVQNSGMGSLTPGAASRTFTFIHTPAPGSAGTVTCSSIDMTPYSLPVSWNPWPVI
jgi:hypothetical protein